MDGQQIKNKDKWNFSTITLAIGYYSNLSFYADYMNENGNTWILVLSLFCYCLFFVKRNCSSDWNSRSYFGLFFSIFLFLGVFTFSFFFWSEMTVILKILILVNILFNLVFLINKIKRILPDPDGSDNK